MRYYPWPVDKHVRIGSAHAFSAGAGVSAPPHTIATAEEADLADLLPLLRAYCDFYETAPGDEALLELSRTLIADPQREGVQLIARDHIRGAVGFASVFWSWDTTEATSRGDHERPLRRIRERAAQGSPTR